MGLDEGQELGEREDQVGDTLGQAAVTPDVLCNIRN